MRAKKKYDRPIVAVIFLKAACDVMLWKTSSKEGGPDGGLCLQWEIMSFKQLSPPGRAFCWGRVGRTDSCWCCQDSGSMGETVHHKLISFWRG